MALRIRDSESSQAHNGLIESVVVGSHLVDSKNETHGPQKSEFSERFLL